MSPVHPDSVVGRRVAARNAARHTAVEAPSAPAEDKKAVSPVPTWAIVLLGLLILYGLSKLVLAFPPVAVIIALVVAPILHFKGYGPLSLYSSTADNIRKGAHRK